VKLGRHPSFSLVAHGEDAHLHFIVLRWQWDYVQCYEW